jgi:hypothetical protein
VGGPVETDARSYQAHTSQCGLVAEYRTFLALARTSVRPAEHSDVTLRIFRTKLAGCLAGLLLVEIAQRIAAQAAELRSFGLEVACQSMQRTHLATAFNTQHTTD